MFHQVFICNTPQDPDDSRDPILDQNSLENAPQILKQENTTSGSTAMGYVQTEDLKMAVGELKSEQYTAIDNQIFTKTDIKASEMGHDTKDLLKVTPYSNTTSPPKMIIQQSQQTSVIPPLGPTYSSTPSLEDMVLQPQPTLVNMNENLVQLSAPPVAVIVPATPVIDAGLSQSPTMKIEPSFSLSNVGMSEELKSEKTVTSSSQFKIEGEEPMEDIDLPDHADSGDTEIKNVQVKFQGDTGTNYSRICHKLIVKKDATMTSSEEITKSPTSAQQFVNSQKSLSVKIINTRSKDLQKMHTVKDCTLVINDSPLEYITPEFIQEHHMEPSLNRYDDSSNSDVEEDNVGVNSDSDSVDSSGSDWEKDHFGIHLENKQNPKMGTYPSNSLCTKKRVSSSKSSILSKDSTTKDPVTKPTNNDLAKVHLEINTRQLKLPVKTTNQRSSFHLVPEVGCGSILDVQTIPNKNIQSQALVLSGPLNLHNNKNNGDDDTKLETSVELNRNANTTLSHANKKTSEKDNGLNFRKILPKPCASYTFGVIKAPSHNKYSLPKRVPNGHSNNQGSSTENKSTLPQHLYHCKECDKLFEALEQYVHHKQASLCFVKRQEVKYQCDICGKILANDVTLEEHKNWHTNARPFKCSYCAERYNSKKARHRHYKIKHCNLKSKSPRYLCSYCGYTNSKLKYILAHEEVHRLPEGAEIPKRFECKECGKRFRYSTGLKHHLKFHSTASLLCGICDKGFKSKGNLIQHMITHSNARPISCHLCGDKFKRMAHLKQHKSAIHGEGRTQ